MRALPLLVGAAALTLGVTGTTALAAPSGQPAYGPPGTHRTWGPKDMRRRIDHRLERLRTDLHLHKDQEADWHRFERTVKGQAAAAGKRWREMRGTRPQTAPERLDRGIRFTQERLRALRRLEAVVKPLYASLRPVQRSVFDLEFRRGGFRHGHHRHW
ncbi:MAG TPA: Spy/CpxP family protein refolding chaperone [Gammaproteobacteria bacterium]|nr:Spy/CpxP family protein refolding chaperone [Gammaproteobacteria bacterium]